MMLHTLNELVKHFVNCRRIVFYVPLRRFYFNLISSYQKETKTR